MGDNQILEHTFGVLEDDCPIHILGRDFLRRFGSTEFNWESKSIRLGKIWKKGDSVIQGSDIFARSYVAELDSDDDIKIERDIAQRIPVKINPELPCQKQQALLDLCEEFSDVFAINTKSPQVTLIAKHTIDTGNSQPIRNKQRRVSPTVQYHINEQVEEMLSNGICQPSDSPWSSPVILITKKDGGTRFVIDYRGLNSVTRKDAYPMPNPRDILDKLSGSRIFSTLDCCSAYWAVPVDENDIWKTAFSTSRGHFEMLRMPFGLCNSQATYQRVIDKALKNVECTDTYVDDILVHSPKFEKRLSSLRAVLTRLRNTRIQLRPEKCSLGFDEIEFIGHVLTPHGHKPLPSTVIRINSYIPPHNKKGMQRFLGLVNFYREYIPDFSRIAEPLYRLTRKDVLWEWNSSVLESFEKLKRYLTDSPLLLTYPRWDEPFYVQTDASKTGVGGILSQKDPIGPLKPLAYFSSGLNKSQRNYSATELECWALIAAARKFDVYLKAARKIYFITDHNPLVWLRRQQDPRAKFARWIQEIEGLDYEIKYTKGSENCVADFLSRLDSEIDPKINDESEHFERFVYHVSSTSPDLLAFIKDEQSHDKSITYAYDQTLRTGRVIAGRFRHQQLAISDGLLMRHGRILIPEKARSADNPHP